METPKLTPAQTLALKRLFSCHHGGTQYSRPLGLSGRGLDPRVAKKLEGLGLVKNRMRKLRGSGREVYDVSYLTWKGGHIAWLLCGSPDLRASPTWTKSDPTMTDCDILSYG